MILALDMHEKAYALNQLFHYDRKIYAKALNAAMQYIYESVPTIQYMPLYTKNRKRSHHPLAGEWYQHEYKDEEELERLQIEAGNQLVEQYRNELDKALYANRMAEALQ
jgi:hypothetical protein